MKGTFMAFIMLNCQILDRPSLSKAAIFLELVFSYDVIFSNTPLIKTWSPDYPITQIIQILDSVWQSWMHESLCDFWDEAQTFWLRSGHAA